MTPRCPVQLSSGDSKKRIASLEQEVGAMGEKVSELELSLAKAKQETAVALEETLTKEKVCVCGR